MTTLLLLGFLLGMRHAIEADHVAAVASLVTNNESVGQSVKQGAVWGLGHTLTLFLFGSVALLFNSHISENMASWLEFAVGGLLVILGLDVIRRVYRNRIHFHMHTHEDSHPHFHAHSHANHQNHDEAAHQHTHQKGAFPFRALLVGLMHGMAGASALIVLTVSQIDSTMTALIYMALFGVGSMLGMAVLSAVIAWPLRRSANGLTRLHNGIQYALGGFTLFLGISVMVSQFPV